MITLSRVITNKFYSSTHRGPCETFAEMFSKLNIQKKDNVLVSRLIVEYYIYEIRLSLSEKEKIKVTEMYTSINRNYVRLIELI